MTQSSLGGIQNKMNWNTKILIIKGSCLKALGLLSPEMVDLTITDPAWASLETHRAKGTTTRLKKSEGSSNAWFEIFAWMDLYPLFDRLSKVMKNNSHVYVFCDTISEQILLTGRCAYEPEIDAELYMPGVEEPWGCAPFQAAGTFKAWPSLVWVKTKRMPGKKGERDFLDKMDAFSGENVVKDRLPEDIIPEVGRWCMAPGMGYHGRKAHELIAFLEKGHRNLNVKTMPSVLYGSSPPKNTKASPHASYPTQKPLNVIKELMLNSSNKGDVVLDMFAGSGGVGKVALETGRRAILIDLDVSWILERSGLPEKEITLLEI